MNNSRRTRVCPLKRLLNRCLYIMINQVNNTITLAPLAFGMDMA
ncbi:hypothetical protein [Salinisphaera sp. G21_0]|nr:hypothetical protein [Salinisphaera sp. G21_0]